jgi:hypothetical protein
MLLSDIFSIPFLICLAICILLIGCSSIYFYQRIMQQDHKIASMVSLISSMTEDTPTTQQSVATQPQTQTQTQPKQMCPIQQLISVSDDDESDDSVDGDDDTDSEYSDTSSENDNEHILSAVDFDELNTDLEEIGENPIEEIMDGEYAIACEEIGCEEIGCEDAIACEEIGGDVMGGEVASDETTKSIHLDANTIDFSIFKTINISESHHEESYKKMSLQKLREIAQHNGHSDSSVSKLKKSELLKLLGSE